MATIDNNYQVVGKAVTDDSSATISNLLVDPATGRLLIDILYEDYTTSDPATKIDDIYEGVAMAVTDNAAATIKPIKVNPSNGRVLIDLVTE